MNRKVTMCKYDILGGCLRQIFNILSLTLKDNSIE